MLSQLLWFFLFFPCKKNWPSSIGMFDILNLNYDKIWRFWSSRSCPFQRLDWIVGLLFLHFASLSDFFNKSKFSKKNFKNIFQIVFNLLKRVKIKVSHDPRLIFNIYFLLQNLLYGKMSHSLFGYTYEQSSFLVRAWDVFCGNIFCQTDTLFIPSLYLADGSETNSYESDDG